MKEILIDTPFGKVVYPIEDDLLNLTDDELIQKFIDENKKSRFVSPELLQLIINRKIYRKLIERLSNEKN